MPATKWLDHMQPNTLIGATVFGYFNAISAILTVLTGNVSYLPTGFILGYVVLPIIQGAVSLGIANDNKDLYYVGIVVNILELIVSIYILGVYRFPSSIINLIISIAMVVFLVHERTRLYVKVWFH
jgi:hypothetical protein